MEKICNLCDCYPSYVDMMKTATTYVLRNCSACNFYQHSFCAAPIINNYDWEDTEKCPRACETSGYSPLSIQYSEPIPTKTVGKQYISTILEFAEDKEFEHFESATYESTSLLADIGGAAGLFLGLSVVVTDFVITIYHR